MKERPILFSAPMVRAILDGRKTQTRRAVKRGLDLLNCEPIPAWAAFWECIPCPYGKAGDRLWVRETFMVEPHPSEIGLTREDIPRTWDAAVTAAGTIHYAANPDAWIAADGRRWKPSIYMPRWASRILLEVTGVRVERLQKISEADAYAEGVGLDGDGYCWAHEGASAAGQPLTVSAVDAYRWLWESINGPGSWSANPWVWVVEFRRLNGAAEGGA